MPTTPNVEAGESGLSPQVHALTSRILSLKCAGIQSKVERFAQTGDATALQIMGVLYDRGCGVPQDMPKALGYFERAARKNRNDALSSGYVALYEAGSESDAAGIGLLTKAADAGSTLAASDLAYYFDHRFAEATDPKNADHWAKVASDGGDLIARVQLSEDYATGDGTPANLELAKSLLSQAADAGEPTALAMLGTYYTLGRAGYPKDWARGYSYFKQAVALDSPRAKITYFRTLGMVGIRTPVTADEANTLVPNSAPRLLPRKWFDVLLGAALLGVDGTVPNCPKAIPLVEPGLELTTSMAADVLGYCYSIGTLGVPADYAKALKYEKIAAAKGSDIAVTFLRNQTSGNGNGQGSGYDANQAARDYEGYHWSELHPMSGPR